MKTFMKAAGNKRKRIDGKTSDRQRTNNQPTERTNERMKEQTKEQTNERTYTSNEDFHWAIVISEPTRGPFLAGGPEKFSHPKCRSKISNLLTTELFYSHILHIKRGSLHSRSFKYVHLSVFKYQLTKNGFLGPKRLRGFRETGPRPTFLLRFSLPYGARGEK